MRCRLGASWWIGRSTFHLRLAAIRELGVGARHPISMVEDLTSLKQFRSELAELLGRVDLRIENVERAQRLTPDDVRLRKLDNAIVDGAGLARSEEFSSPDRESALRDYLAGRYRGDRQLVERAVDGARRTWREVAA